MTAKVSWHRGGTVRPGVIGEVIGAIAANADGIAKIIAAVKDTPPPGQQIAGVIGYVMRGVSIGEKIGLDKAIPPEELAKRFNTPPKP